MLFRSDINRLSPEAPVPVLNPTKTIHNPGMAGNVKQNLRSLGYDPRLLTNMNLLNGQEELIIRDEYQPTQITKTRFVDKQTGYIVLRVDENDEVKEPLTKSMFDVGQTSLSDFDLVIVADYNKGFLTEEIMSYVFKNSKCSFLDTKRKIGEWAKDVTYIKINHKEFDTHDHRSFLEKESMINKVIVTEGGGGCRINGEYRYVHKVDVRDVSGAGDTFKIGRASCRERV